MMTTMMMERLGNIVEFCRRRYLSQVTETILEIIVTTLRTFYNYYFLTMHTLVKELICVCNYLPNSNDD